MEDVRVSETKLTRYDIDYSVVRGYTIPLCESPNGDYYLASHADARIAELEAEVARLRTENDNWQESVRNLARTSLDLVSDLAEANAQLAAHREAARKIIRRCEQASSALPGSRDILASDGGMVTIESELLRELRTALRSAGEE